MYQDRSEHRDEPPMSLCKLLLLQLLKVPLADRFLSPILSFRELTSPRS